jgi:hypothetical protein
MAIRGYYLGRRGTRTTEFPARYAEVFNTVEGNTENSACSS